MKKLIFVLTISVFCVTGCLSRDNTYKINYDFGDIDKIAILSVSGQVQNEEAKGQISNLFVIELLNKGYTPIPLAQVEAKLHAIAESGEAEMPERDDYVKIGQNLKVPALLLINIPYFDNEIFISAQLINTKDGSVLWMNQSSGDNERLSRESSIDRKGKNQEDFLMDPLLLIQETPGADKTEETAAKPGDKALTPRELRRIEIIVSKICGNLPSAASQKTAQEPKPLIRTTTKPRTTSDW